MMIKRTPNKATGGQPGSHSERGGVLQSTRLSSRRCIEENWVLLRKRQYSSENEERQVN